MLPIVNMFIIMGKYLDLIGLSYLIEKIQATFIKKTDIISADLIQDGTTNKVFTSTEKSKLAGIASGAEVNVQADWNITDTSSDAYIQNKPSIPDNLLSANYEMSSDSNEDLALEAGDTYEEAFAKIEKTIIDNEYVTSSALTELDQRINAIPDPIKPDWNVPSGSPAEILNKPTIPTTYAASATAAGPADKAVSIPFAEVDSTSTGSAFTATVNGITELRDGVCVYLRNGVEDSVEGCTLNINSLGAKPIHSSSTGNPITSAFTIDYTYLFVYNSTRVSGGCWDLYAGYENPNASNTSAYIVRTNSQRLPTTDKFYRYRILFTSLDGTHYIPANTSTSTNATAARTVNQRVIDPFGRIVYYATTTAVNAESMPAAAQCRDQSTLTLGYSFNRTGAALTLTTWKPVYLKCAPQTTGGAIIDADTPYVQDLPVTEDNKIYIFLGVAYSATAIEMLVNHPIYWYKDGAIRQWTNALTQSSGGGGSSSAPIVFDVDSNDDRSDSTIIQRWQEMWDDIDDNPSKYVNIFKYFTFVRSLYSSTYDYACRILTDFSVDKTNRCLRWDHWYYYYNENTGTIEVVYDD